MSEAYTKLDSVEAEEMQTLKENKVIQKEYVLPPATATTLGGVKIGEGINVDENGTISTKNIALKSKYYANDWSEGVITSAKYSKTLDFMISEEYPNNRIITNISVCFEKDGETVEHSLSKLYVIGMLDGSPLINVFSKTEFNEDSGFYTVAFLTNASDSEFFNKVSAGDASVVGFKVYYIEI